MTEQALTNDHLDLAKVINPGHEDGRCARLPCEPCLRSAVAALEWLSIQGRLAPAHTEKRTEWTVCFHRVDGERRVVAALGGVFLDRERAERYAAMQSMFPQVIYPDFSYAHREVLTGPWTEETPSG